MTGGRPVLSPCTLAENNEGYANLMKIVSKGFVEGYYYKPRVDKEVLRKYHSGDYCAERVSGRRGTEIYDERAYNGSEESCVGVQRDLRKDPFYLGTAGSRICLIRRLVNQKLMKMSRETGHRTLWRRNDVHYNLCERRKAHDILCASRPEKAGGREQDEIRRRDGITSSLKKR